MRTGRFNKEKVSFCVLDTRLRRSVPVTWISRVLGMHRKLTVADSFFINSEAISPSPAPCSQSRTRSRFVRIWTALDQENSPSWKEEKEELCPSSQNMWV